MVLPKFPTDTPSPLRPYDDVVVIGSGAAGLTFALEAAKYLSVSILTKDAIREGNTRYAQGGLAAVLRLDDDYQQHIRDTYAAGGEIGDLNAMNILVHEAPARVRDLQHYGVEFDAHLERGLAFTREGGHSENRILHVGDLTGMAIQEALVNQAIFNRRINVHQHTMAIDLITWEGTCYGVTYLDHMGTRRQILSRAVVLATGGAGQLYSTSTNPPVATGDGTAMAARAGAALKDMEFVQFHPTAFKREGVPTFLISEALRGEGAILRNTAGDRFMENVHPMKELAPRDIVARTIYEEMDRLGTEHVYLDISHQPGEWLEKRFPWIVSQCREHGVDPATEPIPVAPAAHYFCGGVKADIDGRTNIAGLYIAGETACTGVHGANRLASNSLLEALVWGYRCAIHSERYIKYLGQEWYKTVADFERCHPAPETGTREVPDTTIGQLRGRLQRLMWQSAGIVRTTMGLRKGFDELETLQGEFDSAVADCRWNRKSLELRNLLTVGRHVLSHAIARQENVGTHYNRDHASRKAKDVERPALN